MGGMAAQIPIKNDPEANEAALDEGAPGQAARSDAPATMEPGWRIRAWCRSPRQIFDEHMPAPNQISREARRRQVTAADLLGVPDGDDHGSRACG